MKFNRLLFLTGIILTAVIVFLIGFILYYLRGPEGYVAEIVFILKTYYFGISILLLLIVNVIISIFMIVRKQSFRIILYWNISILVIFLISYNVAYFTALNQVSDDDKEPLLVLKKNPSIIEAARRTQDSNREKILDYIRMDELLGDRCLIVPESDPLEGDFAFYHFVQPGRIEKKSYNHYLSEESYKALSYYSFEVIRAFWLTGRNYAYFIYSNLDDVSEIYVYVYRRFVVFIPNELAKKVIRR